MAHIVNCIAEVEVGSASKPASPGLPIDSVSPAVLLYWAPLAYTRLSELPL